MSSPDGKIPPAPTSADGLKLLQALMSGDAGPALRRFAAFVEEERQREAVAAARRAAGLEDGACRYRMAPVGGGPVQGVPVSVYEQTGVADLDPEIGRLLFGDLYDRAVALRAETEARRARGEEPTTYVILRTSDASGVDRHGDVLVDEVRLLGIDVVAPPPPPGPVPKAQREIERENLNAIRARGRRWPRRGRR